MKTLYFIRHAEALHNPEVDKYGKSILTNKKYFDARLTDIGLKQCEEHIDEMTKMDVDIVYVSPLYRTLQTANIMFSKSNVRMEALERIRERTGVRPCDKRSPKKVLQKDFPHINFINCMVGDEDPIWKKDYRETEEKLLLRIKSFLEWIKKTPEKSIVIVTHQGYMLRLYKLMGIKFSEPDNCEMIKLEL